MKKDTRLVLRLAAAFAIVLSLLFCAPARAQVLYKPWDSHKAAIQLALTDIPAAFIPKDKAVSVESIGTVEFLQCFEMLYPQEVRNVDYVRGLYLPRPKDGPDTLPSSGSEIFLLNDMTEDAARSALVHEMGHWVWFELCTDDERAQYLAIWRDEDLGNAHVSDYAGTNSNEGFAETFRLWVANPKSVSFKIGMFMTSIQLRLTNEQIARNKALMGLPQVTRPSGRLPYALPQSGMHV
jgi:hypothetical protein